MVDARKLTMITILMTILATHGNSYGIIQSFLTYAFSIESKSDITPDIANQLISAIFHDPIFIRGEKDFHDQAVNEGWDLNGTRDGNKSKPYLIDGYQIYDSLNDLIEIRSTDVYFQVSNCILHGIISRLDGIHLLNVRNGKFVNNSIRRCGIGINLHDSSDNTIINNAISLCQRGINTMDKSNGNIISNNCITDCENVGIDFDFGIQNIISNNTLFNNGDYGVSLGGKNNTLIYNDFIGNNMDPDHSRIQAYCDLSDNTVMYNFWDDWTDPDTDSDGIVDSSEMFIDSHPKTLPNNPQTYDIHFITRPQIIFPATKTQHKISAIWYPAFDSWNHSVLYSVYISYDSSTSWSLVASDLNVTHYVWNASSLDDSTSAQIKVVVSSSCGLISYSVSTLYVPDEFFHTITWLATSPVTAKEFPIAFHCNTITNYCVGITTSWGYEQNYTISWSDLYSNPSTLIWIAIPNTIFFSGQGNVSVVINDLFVETFPVAWEKKQSFDQELLDIQVTYDWFSHWCGDTRLQAVFYADRKVTVQYTILRKGLAFDKKDLPFPKNFKFSTELSSKEWQEFTTYLDDHDPVNWQSWQYNPQRGMADAGGYYYEVTIQWSDSTSTIFAEKRDDDSGLGTRIFTHYTASTFKSMLIDKIQVLITEDVDFDTDLSLSHFVFPLVFLITLGSGLILLKRRKKNQ